MGCGLWAQPTNPAPDASTSARDELKRRALQAVQARSNATVHAEAVAPAPNATAPNATAPNAPAPGAPRVLPGATAPPTPAVAPGPIKIPPPGTATASAPEEIIPPGMIDFR